MVVVDIIKSDKDVQEIISYFGVERSPKWSPN
jgi:hypothetical protein